MKVLAIESTCDETAAAVAEGDLKGVRILKSEVASSAEIHTKYGGVVPEVAAREQVKSIIPVVEQAMAKVSADEVEAVAVSFGPGLMGSLLIGVETAKTLALSWQRKLIKVNHMKAHVAANWIVNDDSTKVPTLPAIALVVSGGHTDLILINDLDNWKWVGGTRDDAAGEAFDKAARILGLPYPGGPEMEKASKQAEEQNFKLEFRLPRPLINEDSLEMSFSGLKEALAKETRKGEISGERKLMLAREFVEAVVGVLCTKTVLAMEKFQPKSVLLAGGVAANQKLRKLLQKEVEAREMSFFTPELKYCGDNAAMVAAAAIIMPEQVVATSLRPEPSLPTA